jgi:hypothetical protein
MTPARDTLRRAMQQPTWVPCTRCGWPVNVSGDPPEWRPVLCFKCGLERIVDHVMGPQP